MPDTEIETGNWAGVDFATHIVLQSNDTKAVEFAVLREAAKMSGVFPTRNFFHSLGLILNAGLIKDMLEDQDQEEQTMIPLPNVSGRTMKYVIQYMEYHYNNKAEPIEKPLKVVLGPFFSRFLFASCRAKSKMSFASGTRSSCTLISSKTGMKSSMSC